MGTYLTHLVADRRAGFWTGYAVEGMFSGDRVSAGGLVRWDARGNRASALRPPEPYRHLTEAVTVNVADSAVHALYWPDAALVETGPGGMLRIRALPVSDPVGLAIRGDRLLLLAGVERGIDRAGRVGAVHHLRGTDGGAVVTGREGLVFPNGDPTVLRGERVGPSVAGEVHGGVAGWGSASLFPYEAPVQGSRTSGTAPPSRGGGAVSVCGGAVSLRRGGGDGCCR
ncbi:hypothetical protein ACWGCI_22550 [Streptomyces sp. NPDC054949]